MSIAPSQEHITTSLQPGTGALVTLQSHKWSDDFCSHRIDAFLRPRRLQIETCPFDISCGGVCAVSYSLFNSVASTSVSTSSALQGHISQLHAVYASEHHSRPSRPSECGASKEMATSVCRWKCMLHNMLDQGNAYQPQPSIRFSPVPEIVRCNEG
jgi:hypothetical protein